MIPQPETGEHQHCRDPAPRADRPRGDVERLPFHAVFEVTDPAPAICTMSWPKILWPAWAVGSRSVLGTLCAHSATKVRPIGEMHEAPRHSATRGGIGLRRFNAVVGLAHLAQAVAMVALSNDLALPVIATFLADDPVTAAQGMPEVLFEAPIGPLVALFLGLAGVDHLLVAAPRVQGWYERNLRHGINYARWIEYSVSASVMIVLIAMFTGIWDIGALIGLVGANTAMIWLGLLMERHQQPGSPDWTAFALGTVTGLVPWIAIGLYLAGAATAPGFVYAIVGFQFLLFAMFGANQYLQYARVGPWRDYRYGEVAYVVLSLAAKSLLAWLIFANVLRA